MKKVALVHDFLIYYGGAEGVFKNLSRIYPEADLYVLMKDTSFCEEYFPKRKIRTSFLQKFPKFLRKRSCFLLPFMPTAPETLNLRDYDLVISSSSAFAKGVVLKPKTKHVSYIHAPMRYVWDWKYEYLQEKKIGSSIKFFTRLLLSYLRLWDRASAERVDYFVANSKYTARRIKKYYRKESVVIYPPVDVDKFQFSDKKGSYFLSVGRLSSYKKMDVLVESFKKLKLPLIIVGEGEEKERLRKMAKGFDIQILGWVDDEKLKDLYQNSRAFVCATEDDFNIAVVEAMACGKPVIALRAGGTAETVIEGVTGEFFDIPQLEMVADGIRKFIENEESYDSRRIRKHAESFSLKRFNKEFTSYIKKVSQENN